MDIDDIGALFSPDQLRRAGISHLAPETIAVLKREMGLTASFLVGSQIAPILTADQRHALAEAGDSDDDALATMVVGEQVSNAAELFERSVEQVIEAVRRGMALASASSPEVD